MQLLAVAGDKRIIDFFWIENESRTSFQMSRYSPTNVKMKTL
jgi:hypothetical protein